MKLAAIVSHFTDEHGRIAVPDHFSVAGMSEMLFTMAQAAGKSDDIVLRGWRYDNNPAGEHTTYTRAELNTRIKVVAARLQQTTHIGARVALLMGNSPEYIVGFLGAMYAGMTPVPLYDPNEPGHADHLQAVLADCAPQIVLTNSHSAGAVRAVFADRPASQRPRILSVDALPDSLAANWVSPEHTEEGKQALAGLAATGQALADSVAFLQYTSGSTRSPAGVQITHRSLIVNALQIYGAVHLQEPQRIVMWLPLHHDMGIVLAMIFAVMGEPIDLLSPRDFLQRPARYLSLLSKTRDDEHIYTAMPNFALEICARYGQPSGETTLDLSRVQGIFVGSEPVTPLAVERFTTTFAPCGLNPEAVMPGYGLAEATLLVSVVQKPGGTRVFHADRAALAAGTVAIKTTADDTTTPLVSCGNQVQPMALTIVDPDTREELPEGRIGEIWVHGQNMAKGYLDREEETRETFRNRLASKLATGSRVADTPDDDYWMATGDLGVIIDDEIIITGRRKDLIVIAGRNHYPQDIEYTATQATQHIAAGIVAAFAVTGDNTEQLVLIAERDPEADKAGDEQAITDIRAAVTARHGIAPNTIRIVEPGAIKRSSSGKIARRVNRQAYLDGRI
ncbi:FadD32-like long-chain-fatty-acid--AMP ligase [Corynebacterium choanae]|uniref:Long-chain-fatty-acid--AMP ligase FadD32 n=1 Tax=Corynebacterium choanae TaxID=1862358 RepID=A0A3G6J4B3_9CORY|nr:FadD32-like long-chain-fatty-acid--AMP ligase [Corynebacterium choanae]AZA12553.1 Long-chain-fatty-acid--AMP ligase FadD32 [Corynebacterium choanae]